MKITRSKQPIKKYLILLAVILGAAVSSCQKDATYPDTVSFQPGKNTVNLSPSMAFYTDHEKKLSIDNVAAEEFQKNFIPNRRPTSPYWPGEEFVWIRLQFSGEEPQEELYIFFSTPGIELAELYLPRKDGFHKIAIDFNLPEEERPHPGRKIIFPLKTLQKDEAALAGKTIYIKTYSPLEYHQSALLVNNEGLLQAVYKDTMLDIIFLTIIVVMAVYNFFVYLNIRDKSYLLYVLYISTFALSVYAGIGFTQAHFGISFKSSIYIGLDLNIILVILVSLFTQSFLGLKQKLPRFHQLLHFLNITLLVTLAISVVSLITAKEIFYVVMPVVSLCILTVALLLYRKFPYARDFARAWAVLVVSGVIYSFVTMGFYIPYVTMYILQIGGAIESLLLAFALARRIRYLEGEKQEFNILKRNLALAKKIEQNFFPHPPPNSKHYTIAWRYFQSEKFNGNFYDYKVENNLLAINIVNVTQTGYAASLVASMVQVAFHETFNVNMPLKQQLENVNRILCKHIHMLYTTATCLRIFPVQKEFDLVCSGYTPLLHYSKQKNKIIVHSPPGGPLGVAKEYKCKNLSIPYHSGDRLLLFSKGLLEEFNKKEENGLEELSATLLRNREQPPEEFCNRLHVQLKHQLKNSTGYDGIFFLTIELL